MLDVIKKISCGVTSNKKKRRKSIGKKNNSDFNYEKFTQNNLDILSETSWSSLDISIN